SKINSLRASHIMCSKAPAFSLRAKATFHFTSLRETSFNTGLLDEINKEENMEKKELISSIAYCGLICKLCFLASKCDGCKTANNICDRNLADKGCPQKECCT
ncbi:MAG: hypothetical protein OQK71_02170, partial [Desulfobacter sp.]|nr:hypothetical protein [Desulfobacter sp.]